MEFPTKDAFRASALEQIRINQARTPTERFLALCALLDFANAIAPRTPEADARRHRALAARERDREEMREHFRRLIAAQRGAAADGVCYADRAMGRGAGCGPLTPGSKATVDYGFSFFAAPPESAFFNSSASRFSHAARPAPTSVSISAPDGSISTVVGKP